MNGSAKLLLTLFLVGAGIILYNYGTLSPCAILRAQVRQQAAREGNFGGDITVILPDSALDAAMEVQYGQLTPRRCIGFLMSSNNTNTQPGTATPPAQPIQPVKNQQPQDARMQWAVEEMGAAIKECRDKRINAELKTYAESANCSNPRIVQAFQQAGYRYMDLIMLFTAKRLELAEKVEKKELTEIQAQQEGMEAFTQIVTTERQRDSMGR